MENKNSALFVSAIAAFTYDSELPLSFENDQVCNRSGCFRVNMELLIIFMVNHTHEQLLFSVLGLKPELSRSNPSLQITAVKVL